MTNRRDFLKHSALATGALAIAGRAPAFSQVAEPESVPIERLLMEAVGAARSGGASFADARIGRYRRQSLSTREQQIVSVADSDSMGVGVRVLVRGTWGFAATRDLTTDGVVRAVAEALAIARANRVVGAPPVVLAPGERHPRATWKSAFVTDPWQVPIEAKAELLLRANAEARAVPTIRFVTSGMQFVKEEKHYANTDGSLIAQTIVRSNVSFVPTAVSADSSDFQTRDAVIQPAARGYEYVLAQDLAGNARRWGEEAAEKLRARSVEPGRYDLVLHPSHLFLTIHESIAHPTELDRAMGHEANYAGTSFLAPPGPSSERLGLGRIS